LFNEAIYRERPELWEAVVYTKLCVDWYMNCGRESVTGSCV